jgi:hypothetical protein
MVDHDPKIIDNSMTLHPSSIPAESIETWLEQL